MRSKVRREFTLRLVTSASNNLWMGRIPLFIWLLVLRSLACAWTFHKLFHFHQSFLQNPKRQKRKSDGASFISRIRIKYFQNSNPDSAVIKRVKGNSFWRIVKHNSGVILKVKCYLFVARAGFYQRALFAWQIFCTFALN